MPQCAKLHVKCFGGFTCGGAFHACRRLLMGRGHALCQTVAKIKKSFLPPANGSFLFYG
ncbi:MAG: hypothetical protein LUH82_06630 [Clostridiales bacterium]|nr:hypothetical protein [Clostridiales bacterium]